MEDVNVALKRIRRKIDKSSGCSYLYQYFDGLVKELEIWVRQHPNETPEELIETIESYAAECNFCNYSSPGWLMYAARSFYCADTLIKFVSDDSGRRNLTHLMSLYFEDLMDSEAISLIDCKILKKYISSNFHNHGIAENYRRCISKAVYTASMHHPVESSVEYLAYRGCKFAHDMIFEYINVYEDYSYLKEWIPSLGTRHLADIWYNFPDRLQRSYKRSHIIEHIEKYLDDSLELHLELWNLWFQYDKEEVLAVCDADLLIDILEVTDDKEFRDILLLLVKIPNSDKVKRILEHFTEDDEDWIVRLSEQLLSKYS